MRELCGKKLPDIISFYNNEIQREGETFLRCILAHSAYYETPEPGGLNNRNLSLTDLEPGKSKIRESAQSGSDEDLLQTAFLLCPPWWGESALWTAHPLIRARVPSRDHHPLAQLEPTTSLRFHLQIPNIIALGIRTPT